MKSDPQDPIFAAAASALRSGAYQEAIEGFEAYLEKVPDERRALIGVAEAYRYYNRTDRIAALYERAVTVNPADHDLRAGLIEALLADMQTERARGLATAAVEANRDVLRFRLLLAQTDMMLGNTDTAQATFWDCLALEAGDTDCLFFLSQLADEKDLPRLKEAMDPLWAGRSDLNTWDAATLGYAFGKLAERQKDFERAWEGFAFGAKTRRGIVRFDETTYSRTYDAHRHTFTAATPTVKDTNAGEGYVFIVSLPRSGSTLVEQILDAHPRVEAIGERSISYDAVTHWHKTHGPAPQTLFTERALSDARAFYEQGARALVQNKDAVIVDKSITNVVFVGFLRSILPAARFVHIARDPLDTAISCFTTSFFAGNEWTYDLGEIGRNIRRYQKIMRYWTSLWPGDILTTRYEDLIADPESESRRIVDFCNLEWDPACLNFHKSKRQVMTASMLQVRQPIYQSAKGRAANYEKHLGPLIAAMGRRAADPNWFMSGE